MSDKIQGIVGTIGVITAWGGVFDFITKGLAISVSVCTLIIIAPKAWATLGRAWVKISKATENRSKLP